MRPSEKPRSLVIMISRAKNLNLQVSQTGREGRCKSDFQEQWQIHTHTWSISFCLLKGQSLPKELQKGLLSSLGFACQTLKGSSRKRNKFKLDFSQKEMNSFPKSFSVQTPTFLLDGLTHCRDSLHCSPGLTCLMFLMLLTMNSGYKNHCRNYVLTEKGMACSHRKLKLKRSCKRNFSINTSIFKNQFSAKAFLPPMSF